MVAYTLGAHWGGAAPRVFLPKISKQLLRGFNQFSAIFVRYGVGGRTL